MHRTGAAAASLDVTDELDVTVEDAATAAVAQAHEHFGRLDVVINNAGFGHFGLTGEIIGEITENEVRARLETNLSGALWISRTASQRTGADRRPNAPSPSRTTLSCTRSGTPRASNAPPADRIASAGSTDP